MCNPLEGTILGGFTGGSIAAGEAARQETKKAGKVQEKIRRLQEARSRLAQIREARMSQAQVVQGGATQGASQSSAVQGGYSAIGSNAENNIQFINQVNTMQEEIAKRMGKANNLQATSQALGQVSSLASQFYGGGS